MREVTGSGDRGEGLQPHGGACRVACGQAEGKREMADLNRAHLKGPGDRLREEKRAEAEGGPWGSLTCLRQETRGTF